MQDRTESTNNSSTGWYVYMVETRCGALYTGITTDVDRRFGEHLARYEGRSTKGARYFGGREPVRVVYREPHSDRVAASRRECEIKKLSALKKRALRDGAKGKK